LEEISIGDYVLSGGELAALVLLEAVARKIPGVLGHHQSARRDSFSDGLLEAPSFTRPQSWQGLNVPAVLLQGHHQMIEEWRQNMASLVTLCKRPDVYFRSRPVDLAMLKQFWLALAPDERKVCGVQNIPWEKYGI
ncbi:MAG: tRNA (guanosine(37)-N1)-methyltransferase TrmD, partial [Bdellovibrionaceae bacterium]|nr:tRNA (guanosine(37)-N1)-methyltransferase TrmD [Pseudobdellovibrionaceae bacterium]